MSKILRLEAESRPRYRKSLTSTEDRAAVRRPRCCPHCGADRAEELGLTIWEDGIERQMECRVCSKSWIIVYSPVRGEKN